MTELHTEANEMSAFVFIGIIKGYNFNYMFEKHFQG